MVRENVSCVFISCKFNWRTDRSKADFLFWLSVTCFLCQSFDDVSPYVCSYKF